MKTLILTLSLLALISCGKTNRNGKNEGIYGTQYNVGRSFQVYGPLEAHNALLMAIRMNRLYEYHGARFYLYNGQYLFRVQVINAVNYKITL